MAEESSGFYPPPGATSTMLRKQSAPAVYAPTVAVSLEPPEQSMRQSEPQQGETQKAQEADGATKEDSNHDEEEGEEEEEEEEDEAADQEPLPFPGFVPVTFKYLKQTDLPRFWCLRLITYPYPFKV